MARASRSTPRLPAPAWTAGPVTRLPMSSAWRLLGAPSFNVPSMHLVFNSGFRENASRIFASLDSEQLRGMRGSSLVLHRGTSPKWFGLCGAWRRALGLVASELVTDSLTLQLVPPAICAETHTAGPRAAA